MIGSQRFAGGGLGLRWSAVQGRPGLGATLEILGEIRAIGYPFGAADSLDG